MISVSEKSHDNVLGFKVTDSITAKDLDEFEPVAEKVFNRYDKVNWLCELDTLKYDSLKTFYRDMKWATTHLEESGRMAVVGHGKLLELLVKTDSIVCGEKWFDVADIDKAWAYVNGKD